ncbi:MAG: hypothetical protein WC748_05520 [Legionellales bacterium]|jgi:hypothetical protein
MSEKRIIRFLDKNGLLTSLGLKRDSLPKYSDVHPSFILRSLRYYQELESGGFKGDNNESKIIKDGLTFENGTRALISCWSHPEHDLLKQSQCVNDPGDDTIVGAIESNVDEIKKIIDLITNDKFYGSIRTCGTSHRSVDYSKPHPSKINDQENEHARHCTYFYKDEKFLCQKEYRFVILLNSTYDFSPETYIARLSNREFIKKIHLFDKKSFKDIEIQAINMCYPSIISAF